MSRGRDPWTDRLLLLLLQRVDRAENESRSREVLLWLQDSALTYRMIAAVNTQYRVSVCVT